MKQVKLAAVKRAFARWRAKKRPGQAVPEELWDRAVAASKVHGPTRIAAKGAVDVRASRSARMWLRAAIGRL